MKIKISNVVFIALLVAMKITSSQIIISEMVLIPGGEYTMGKTIKGNADFSPAHQVVVDSFFIDKYEVTNAEYFKFCKEKNYKLPEYWNVDIFRSGENYPDYPVIGITWADAAQYAKWAGKRLPTEAEWEFAARGGLSGKEYPNGDNWDRPRTLNKPGEWVNQVEKVGTFSPNGYGLYHMDGNVWEWVSDNYSENYYSASPKENPKGPATGTSKVIRSGSWHSGDMCKKVYYRKGLPGGWVDFGVGFRCAKNIR